MDPGHNQMRPPSPLLAFFDVGKSPIFKGVRKKNQLYQIYVSTSLALFLAFLIRYNYFKSSFSFLYSTIPQILQICKSPKCEVNDRLAFVCFTD